MKATEQYFPVVLFIILYKVDLTFESVDEILKCDHSNESYWALLSGCAVYYIVQEGFNLCVFRGTQQENFSKLLEILFSVFLDYFRAF